MHIGRGSERTIPGLGITIKQATADREKDEEGKSKAPTIREADTPRIRTELQTWVPTLQQPPMPPSVIDELRGKYSKFRTRHDDDWVAEKLVEDEKLEVKKKAVQLTRTPTQEYVLLQHLEATKIAKAKVLTDDILTILGEHMSRETRLNNPQTAPKEASPT
jgi:large subunit ribosomal protein L24